MTDVLPEVSAAARVGDLLGKHLPSYFSREFWTTVGGKAVASRDALRLIFSELDADPARLRDQDVHLRQDRIAETDSVVWWQEHTAHLKREYEDAAAILERVTAAAHRDRFDPSAREDDREDDRRAAALHDEKAASDAPRLAG